MKVLLTEVIHPVLGERLQQAGFDCTHLETTTYAEVKQRLAAYNGLVVRSNIRVNRDLMDAAPNLHFIGRVGSGLELIEVGYALERGIACFNSPEGNRDAVGEHCVGLLLGLLRNIPKADAELRQRRWIRLPNAGEELGGKTVGIVGYGQMGSAFANRLRSFGVSILAYDKYKTGFGDMEVEEVDLKTLQARADIVSVHLPLNEETHHLVNQQWIAAFAKPLYLLNTSRGAVADTWAVLQGLESGKIKGAGLDVFENEQLATFSANDWQWFNALIERRNVVLTPHLAGVTHQSHFKIAAVLADKIIAHFAD